VEALRVFTSELPADLDAAILVVLHLAPAAPSVLPDILGRAGALPVSAAEDGVALERGHVVVAVPDHHLCVDDGRVRLTREAKENGHRPAIDATFRSAAVAFGSATVGIILSGMLADGVLGLRAISDVGGVTAVQDPDEAPYPSMPASAIRAGVADHVMPARELARLAAGRSESLAAAGHIGESGRALARADILRRVLLDRGDDSVA
jgi:two-component system chemotaxis response regulator CheB